MSKKEIEDGSVFEELYLKEKKKNSILLGIAIVLAIVTVGSLIWASGKQSSESSQTSEGPRAGQFGPGQGGMRGQGMGMDITSYFNEDGSVDTAAVEEIIARFPSGASSRFTDRIKESADQAVTDGDITQEQADALIAEIESQAEAASTESN